MQSTALRQVQRASAIVIISACISANPVAAQVAVRTVGGVKELTVASLTPNNSVAELTPRLQFSTANRNTLLELFRVTGVQLLSDGTVVIANSGTHEVLVLSPEGRLQHRFGGEGRGPGEFVNLASLHIGAANELITYDPRQGRLTYFTPAGAVTRTKSLSEQTAIVDVQPLTVTREGEVLAVYGEMRLFAARGEKRDTVPLFHFDSTGALSTVLGRWPGREFVYTPVEQGVRRWPVGFGRTLAASGRNGRVAIGSTDSLAVSVYDGSRLRFRISGTYPPMPISQADVAAWRAERQASVADAPEATQRAVREIPHRRTYPAFESLMVDHEGRIWIGSYPKRGEERQAWLVVDPETGRERRITFPAGSRLMDARGNRVALLQLNEWGEESVHLFVVE